MAMIAFNWTYVNLYVERHTLEPAKAHAHLQPLTPQSVIVAYIRVLLLQKDLLPHNLLSPIR